MHSRKPLQALLLGICLLLSSASIPASAEDLIISAAGSLTKILPQVSAGFISSHPGVKLLYNFGASGNLLQQFVHYLRSATAQEIFRRHGFLPVEGVLP
ncbi:MAG: hypothetical protein AB7T01_04285 [Acidithiobacillus sp.]